MNKKEIIYYKLNISDINEAYILVREVYDEFVSNENTEQGNGVFYGFSKNDGRKLINGIHFVSMSYKINKSS